MRLEVREDVMSHLGVKFTRKKAISEGNKRSDINDDKLGDVKINSGEDVGEWREDAE